MRIILSSEKTLLTEAAFFKKQIESLFGIDINVSHVQNSLSRAYGWTSFNELSSHHRKASSKLIQGSDCLLESLSTNQIEKLQNQKYLQFYSLIEQIAGYDALQDEMFGKFIDKVENKRLSFLAKVIGKKQKFHQEPANFLAQPLSILNHSTLFLGSMHDLLDVGFGVNEQAYNSDFGSIWINTSARPEDIMSKLMHRGFGSVVSYSFGDHFKLHDSLRNTVGLLGFAPLKSIESSIWNDRYFGIIKEILLVNRLELERATTAKEVISLLSLDSFIQGCKNSDFKGISNEFLINNTGITQEQIANGDKPQLNFQEMWGYITMQVTPLILDYFDAFSPTGLKALEIFESREHVILTSKNDAEHLALIHSFRNYLAPQLGCSLIGSSNQARPKKINRVLNIEQRKELMMRGFSIVTAQARSLGYYTSHYIFESKGYSASGVTDELASVNANTKIKVTPTVARNGEVTIESPFYKSFQSHNYIKINL